MKKYHVSEGEMTAGQLVECNAITKACPLGVANHYYFDDPKHVQAFTELSLAVSTGSVLSNRQKARLEELKRVSEENNPQLSGVTESVYRSLRQDLPKVLTESYITDRFYGGDASRFDFVQALEDRDLSFETVSAIGRMSLREDVSLSYNELSGSVEDGVSRVDLLDEDFFEGSVKDFVSAGAADLPWN